MSNTTFKSMTTELKNLEANMIKTIDLVKLQREHEEAAAVVADLQKKIVELTDIISYDTAAISPKIDELNALNVIAQGKLTTLAATVEQVEANHKAAYDEYTRLKAGIETLKDLDSKNYQKMVDDITIG